MGLRDVHYQRNKMSLLVNHNGATLQIYTFTPKCIKIITERILIGEMATSQLQKEECTGYRQYTGTNRKWVCWSGSQNPPLWSFLFEKSGYFTGTPATPEDNSGYFSDTLYKERFGGLFSLLTLLHFLTHTLFVAQKNNFLVISALLWVVINFSSFHNGLRVWAKKFDLLSKIYQFISPCNRSIYVLIALLFFFWSHLMWEHL